MKKEFDIYTFLSSRPLSWSAISSFRWSKEEWFSRYILGEKTEPSKEMLFGKLFADSCEKGKPLAPVQIYSKVEYPLRVMFGKIPLVGFADTYEPHTKLGEFKTSKKVWTQKKVDGHQQIDMYLLMLFITHKVKPEDIECQLQCIQTQENGDFSIEFVKPIKVHTFKTKRTMADILKFGVFIKSTVEEMQQYVLSKK